MSEWTFTYRYIGDCTVCGEPVGDDERGYVWRRSVGQWHPACEVEAYRALANGDAV